jgi:hypothetical protein
VALAAGRRAFSDRGTAYELLAIAEAARGALPAAREARAVLTARAERTNTSSLLAAVRRADAAIATAAARGWLA